MIRPALLLLFLSASTCNVFAGAQIYEPLAVEVRAGLQASIADRPAPEHGFTDSVAAVDWLTDMSQRLQKKIPNFQSRLDFLRTVHYEAVRAGLDPQLVLALIDVESKFRKYAVSKFGARGYMQVMPFWVKLIGQKSDNLFSLRTNLRYGCVILRHYLDIENGNLVRALGRYNGTLDKPAYPNAVMGAWRSAWRYQGKLAAAPVSSRPREITSFRRGQVGKISAIVA